MRYLRETWAGASDRDNRLLIRWDREDGGAPEYYRGHGVWEYNHGLFQILTGNIEVDEVRGSEVERLMNRIDKLDDPPGSYKRVFREY